MTRRLLLVVLTISGFALAQSPSAKRPKITGIDHVAFYTTALEANRHVYDVILGLPSAEPIEPGETQRFVTGTQWVGYSPAPEPKATDRLDHVAFTTDDVSALRSYMAAHGVKVPEELQQRPDGSRSFQVLDPEGHRIEFVQRSASNIVVQLAHTLRENSDSKGSTASVSSTRADDGDPVSRRMIHAGFIVRDRDAEDRFYKDLLGFHVYWHGGMKPEHTDWVAMQVPDGTDWLEYMLNIEANPSLRTTGVMNHISLGVANMQKAEAKVEAHGWDPHGDQHVQMGKDGKWQLNLFDPDFTRIELMEFKPAEKPCCSDFQGPHPQEP